MNEISFTVENLADLRKQIPEIVALLDGPILVLLSGDLGAGKTTLVQEICTYLGVQDNVTSPTFSLIQEYRTAAEKPVFHADLYRLESSSQLTEIGIMEIMEANQWVFIEWPEIAKEILSARYCTVQIESDVGQQRKIVISHYPQ